MNSVDLYDYDSPWEVIDWLNKQLGPATIRWDIKQLQFISFKNPKTR
jgi:hypothetical protein